MSNTQRLKDKIALVTGASRGIGAAVAKRYAKEGAHVILTARTIGGLEEVDDAIQAAGGTASIVPLDVKEGAKIDELGSIIAERYGKLDIFLGNAAMLGMLSPVAQTDPKLWNDVMMVNVNANHRFLRSLDPLLRSAEAARVLFVTSGVTQSVHPYWGVYAASKAALEMMVKAYAAEVDNTNIKVNLVDPGVVATNMRKSAMPGEDQEALAKPDEITEIFVKLAEASLNEHGNRFNAE